MSDVTNNWLMTAATKNPEGLLLLAAGCALLLRGGSALGGRQQSSSQTLDHDPDRQNESSRVPSGVSAGISQAGEAARETESDVGSAVSERASGYANAVSGYVDDARRTIADQSGHLAEHAQSAVQSTLNRVLRGQPLALAVVGFAAGAALAAALPATAIERRTLGPAGERLSNAAASAGQQVNKAASAAGEKLMDAAEKRGLNVDGLAEMVGDAAGTFKATLTGEKSNSERFSTGGGAPSESGSETATLGDSHGILGKAPEQGKPVSGTSNT